MSFWDPDGTENETQEFHRPEVTETPRKEYRPRHAGQARVWVVGWLVGVSVGIVALGGGLLLGRYATPPREVKVPVIETITETPEPEVSVSTRRGWRTREIEVPGPTETVTTSVSGPTQTVTRTPRPVTITRTVEVTPDVDTSPELPGN